ncbi:sodium/calcium exchanger 1-like isoform X2 [Hyla sarda]|uniref:sodium/calcium exchanger 1-like isoform X2 n=1 Tax=Hyla sarda TaxID=327740 RepID=UPI0024C27075|nr:sodium/calcium exchanger 1-like isoform X2 [Hyla sarda]
MGRNKVIHQTLDPHFPSFSTMYVFIFSLMLIPSIFGASTPPPNASTCGPSQREECIDGVILPAWLPHPPSTGDRAARAIVYFVALVYMFLGMSIIADRFMASIEVITSQERQITLRRPNGEVTVTSVRLWNETVSNLTLMALGSSAPEILLSIIEVVGRGFEAGDMGPSTIVGSAAFNMFVIIGLCVMVVPDGETRRIRHPRVFAVTAFWSVFAYVWLFLILSWSSPGEVEVWEALLTFFFFPVCVLQAWLADRRLLFYRYSGRRQGRAKYRAGKNRGVLVGAEDTGGQEDVGEMRITSGERVIDFDDEEEEEERRDMARVFKDMRQRYPGKDMEQLMELANYQALVQQQKSRAFYRIQATRMMIGAGNVLKKHAADQARRALTDGGNKDGEGSGRGENGETWTEVEFEHTHYQCFENCGTVSVWVLCKRAEGEGAVQVDYRTEDGTANAGSDYELAEGSLIFQPGESKKEIRLGIIDDDVFEEDEHFYVQLSNPRKARGVRDGPGHVRLGTGRRATVTIFDDDHAGIFSFESGSMRVSESIGTMRAKVVRGSGARGKVVIPYRTSEGSAKAGEDYLEVAGKVEFQNDETTRYIEIQIIDDEEYEKNKNFFIELGEPEMQRGGKMKMKMNRQVESKLRSREGRKVSGDNGERWVVCTKSGEEIAGSPSLGEHRKMEVIIEESYEFKNTVDKLIKKANLALVVGSSSWREQFVSAVTVSADDDDEESSEEGLPSCCDYIMHFLTVFWKVLFAFVPPTEYWGGWACFLVSICIIGILTAVTGDLAAHFGCTVGLKDSVTAVVFVALGTSVPDTFASKVAAVQDPHADASIGNVTGSNAVNVFLGLGVAWSIAAIFWAGQGKTFHVSPGSLAFSVTLFTGLSLVCLCVLLYRRRPPIGGELGGPRLPKILTALVFVGLWLVYILLASLEAYCHIPGF